MRNIPPAGVQSRLGVGSCCRRLAVACLAAGSIGLSTIAPSAQAQNSTLTLPPAGVHLQEVNYFSPIIFSNALAHASRIWWVESAPPWTNPTPAPLLYNSTYVDANGNPIAVPTKSGTTTPDPLVTGVNSFANSFGGRVVLTWTGRADIRVTNYLITRQSDYPSGHPQYNNGATSAGTGLLTGGRRAYTVPANSSVEIKVYAVDATNPPKDIRLWIPHPDAAASYSLEPSERTLVTLPAGDVELTFRTQATGQMFNPQVLRALKQRNWRYLRTMTMTSTNGNSEVNWSDRRLPSALQQSSALLTTNGIRNVGVSWETLIALCNLTDLDLWICVPHQATVTSGGYVEKLARLIRYGGKANGEPFNPSSDPAGDKVHDGLKSSLKVWIEYSNEVWNPIFGQNTWVANQPGVGASNVPIFVAERSAKIWKIFEGVFNDATQMARLVRVLPTRAAGDPGYIQKVIDRAMDPTLTVDGAAAPRPDVVATANYFGYDIQTYVLTKILGATLNTDRQTNSAFYFYPSDVASRVDDPANYTKVFDEFRARMIAGQAGGSLGIDSTDVPGGFDILNRTLSASYGLPLISYEGGPSIYTDTLDGGSSQDDWVTKFVVKMNSDPRMADVYRIHLNQGWERGLWAHMPFEMLGGWSKYGQWGHIEGMNITGSVKWEFIKAWYDEVLTLRHIDQPLNAVPQFDQATALPAVRVGSPVNFDITTSGGNGARVVQIVGASLQPGLSAAVVAGDASRVRITGTTNVVGSNLLYLRVRDNDGDPAWKTFRFDSKRYLNDSEANLRFDINQVVLPGTSTGSARASDAYTTSLLRYNFLTGDTQPLFNVGNPATTPAFYGGLQATSAGGLSLSHTFRLNNTTSGWPGFKAPFLFVSANATAPAKVTWIPIWKKNQMTGVNAAQPVALNSTSELWVTVGAPGASTWPGMKLRFVVRNGTQYYLSEQVFSRGGVSGTSEYFLNEFNNNSAEGKRWYAFNPTATDFAVPASLGTPSAVNFNDVTEVGFVGEGSRTYGATYAFQKFLLFIGNPLVKFDPTQVVLPNNGTFTDAGAGFVSGSTTVRRRDFSTANGQPLFLVGNPQNVPAFYGGVEITGPPNHISYARLHNSTATWPNTPSSYVWSSSNATTPASVKFHVLFRKDQFQGSPVGNVSFTSGGRLAVTLGLLSGTSLGNTALRFVVKNGTQYYLSEYAYSVSNGINGTVEVVLDGFQNSSTTGKRWYAFNPTATDFGIPATLGTASAVDFTNVQEVGFILQGSRNYGALWPWQKFVVSGATW